MVQQKKHIPSLHDKPKFVGIIIFFTAIVSLGSILIFGLPPFLEEGPEGEYTLSRKRQSDLKEKPLKSERIEVYRLVATTAGYYPCYHCEGGNARIYLNPGEVWKYGISRNGKGRYSKKFYFSNNLTYHLITITNILKAEQLELELIISYPLLPECQKRMKLQHIFLKRPPGNAVDK